jgi:DNA-binding transcriptional LysR family regulator
MDWTHRLRLRQLQMLLSIAETGNLSQSAAALNTTQPALSKWLKDLEDDLQLQLFERHARGLRPTPYGEALIEHAFRIIGHLDSARDDMQALHNGGSGLVVIGTSGVSASDLVPLAIARLLEKMPRAQVRVHEDTMNRLVPQLQHGEVDIIVGRAVISPIAEDFQVETLYRDPVDFVAGHAHPLAGRDSLDWEDVLAYPWIVWPEGTPTRSALNSALAAAKLSMPRYCVESNSSILNITLLQNSELLGTASHRVAMRFQRMNLLRILPMPLGGDGVVSMYWRANNENRRAVALALDCLRASAI